MKSDSVLLKQAYSKFTRTKPYKSAKFTNRYNWDYSGVISYSCDYNNNCEEYGCDSICRCQRISNVKIENYTSSILIENLSKNISNEILRYAIDRIVRLAKITEDHFEADIDPGYYGEFISAINLSENKEKFLFDNLSKLENMSNENIIKSLLELEYGYLLDSLKDKFSVSIEEIDIEEISFQEVYRKKIDLSEDYYDENFILPRGICTKINNRYQLIDGYHRVLKAKSIGQNTIKMLILLLR